MKLKPITIMVPFPDEDSPKEREREERKEVMAILSEMSYHLPNVCPEHQERVASFMVEQLQGKTTLKPPETTDDAKLSEPLRLVSHSGPGRNSDHVA